VRSGSIARVTVPARISLVTLGVDDLARATAFYEALGWRRSSASNDEVSFFATADGVLALYPFPSLAVDAGLPPGPLPPPGRATLAINVGSEEDVDRVLAEVAAAGATVPAAASRTAWGGYLGWFSDPDGHLWEVTHNPGFPLDERGSVVLPA
jgi:catechol 2,3-dioxygenase-like lactoylglutathione lyase family enzyme